MIVFGTKIFLPNSASKDSEMLRNMLPTNSAAYISKVLVKLALLLYHVSMTLETSSYRDYSTVSSTVA